MHTEDLARVIRVKKHVSVKLDNIRYCWGQTTNWNNHLVHTLKMLLEQGEITRNEVLEKIDSSLKLTGCMMLTELQTSDVDHLSAPETLAYLMLSGEISKKQLEYVESKLDHGETLDEFLDSHNPKALLEGVFKDLTTEKEKVFLAESFIDDYDPHPCCC